jgi:hypothetical protein
MWHKINRNCPSISDKEDLVSKTQQILLKFPTTLSITDPADLFALNSNIFLNIRIFNVQDFRNLQATVIPARLEILDLYEHIRTTVHVKSFWQIIYIRVLQILILVPLLERQTFLTGMRLYWRNSQLTLILPKWRKWWAPNNVSKWQMGLNSAFKRLNKDSSF